jgi:hypothetical protein
MGKWYTNSEEVLQVRLERVQPGQALRIHLIKEYILGQW